MKPVSKLIANNELRCLFLPLVLFAIFPKIAHSAEAILLNCELDEGYPDVQIYINEGEKYILYNAQFRSDSNYSRERVYTITNGAPGQTATIDEGLDIHESSDQFIQASSKNASITFVKDNASFAYAWTTLVTGVGANFLPFGSNVSGKCSLNPFLQN